MAGITGIGGVFFKAKDPDALGKWYQEHLGLPLNPQFGCAILPWQKDAQADTAWTLAKQDSDWFPGPFMINYRVADLTTLVQQLTAAGIPIHQGPEEHPQGLFAWVIDPEGNKVELWEPKAEV